MLFWENMRNVNWKYCKTKKQRKYSKLQKQRLSYDVLIHVTRGFSVYDRAVAQAGFFFLGYWHCGHSWPIVPASGDSEDDCGGADGM
jgi:hypothetical protein